MNDSCEKKKAGPAKKSPIKVDKEIFAQKNALRDLVEYQRGAVVSRTLVDTPACTVTVFAFDARQGLSEHSAPFHALVQVLEGEVEIRIGGAPLRMSEGDVVVMPANIPHALKALTKFKMQLTMARG